LITSNCADGRQLINCPDYQKLGINIIPGKKLYENQSLVVEFGGDTNKNIAIVLIPLPEEAKIFYNES